MNKSTKLKLMVKDFGILFIAKYFFLKKTGQYEKYVKMVCDYLTSYLKDYILDFNKEQHKNKEIIENNNIWVCWWQGEKYMPEFCRMCYQNLINNIPNKYSIHLVTRDNYRQYTDIPDFIIYKMENGIIPITQFSDILRQNLLLKNGGLWIDTSVWVTNDFLSKLDTNLPFWSVKLNAIDDPSVWGQLISNCKWGSFILYGISGNEVFKFVYGAMCKYYKDHNSIIDYFLQNIFIRIAYDNVDIIRKQIDDVKVSNENLYDLYRVIDDPYNEEIWNFYCENTGFFKLTQKREYIEYVDGKITFYGYLKKMAYKK